VIAEHDMHRADICQTGKPPVEAVDKLRRDALRLRVNNVTSDKNNIGLEVSSLDDQVFKCIRILIVTCKATPMNIAHVKTAKTHLYS